LTGVSDTVELCHLEELEVGKARGFDPFGEGRDALFIVRGTDGLKAYRNVCPHQGASLPWQRNAYLNSQGTRIVCSAHGAQFDIDTGRCLQGPALGHSLEPVEISISDAGIVQAATLRLTSLITDARSTSCREDK
jgi:nitrite reductase/ring-hydroxylating ferredoxin subunit